MALSSSPICAQAGHTKLSRSHLDQAIHSSRCHRELVSWMDPPCSLTSHMPLASFPAAPACSLGLVTDSVTSTWLYPPCSGAVGLHPKVRAPLCLRSPSGWHVPLSRQCCSPPHQHCSEGALPPGATSAAPPTSRDLGVVHRQVGICFNGDLVVIDIPGALQEDGKCWDSCCSHCSSSPKHSCEVTVHGGAPADLVVPGATPGPHSTLTLGTGQRYWHRQKPSWALGAVNPTGITSMCTCTSLSITD